MKYTIARVIALFAAMYVYLRYTRLVFQFHRKLKRWPRPGYPRSYADRLMWRKVFDRDPRFTRVSDKLAVKEFVRERVGDQVKTPRTLWVGTRADDIPAELLTGNVVVKPNHSYAAYTMVRDGVVDHAKLIEDARGWMMREHWVLAGEWAYEDIDRKLFIEEMLMVDGKPVDLDVKVHTYGGVGMFANLITGRGSNPTAEVVDRAGNRYGGNSVFPPPATLKPIPPNLVRAMDIAGEICAEFDFMRCDLYLVGDDIYVGELTVYPTAGWGEWKNKVSLAAKNAAWDLRRSRFVSQERTGLTGLYAWALRTLVGRDFRAAPATRSTAS